ncbi:nSTAND1 domain-containing NTPase [Sorangium sp. So ce854]|uniref:nSTAND1 domain-containing NTPase n=1 Tax=Sorangium sp. So ce854 TaxID=3133322 RepID=UPI003F63CF02
MQNPFPGPQPYRASDRDRFYGRGDLAYRLEASILANRCVTVFGPSGAGKSSLVQAAVLPSLIEKQEIRVARVDAWPEDQDPTRWLADAVYGALGLGDRPAGASPADALLTAAQRAARGSPRLAVVYLDQIEQLLYPTRGAAEAEALFDCVDRLAGLPTRNLRLLLSLREDYLGRFRDRLREHRRLLDHGFRVGPLTVAELCEAVCQAAAAGEPPQAWAPADMRPLLLQVRVPGQAAGDEAEAQAAYAQIVCRALFEQRAKGGEAVHAVEAEAILRRYLEATLAGLGALRGGAERLLEDHLVTADGSRTLRTEKELLRVLPAEELGPALKALEGAAILHAAEHQGSRYFEIGHDWLAREVFEQRRQRRHLEARRRERAEAEARLAEERGRRRRSAAVAAAALLVAAGAAALGSVAYGQKLRADRLRVEEVRARREADRQRDVAEERRSEAHDARILAGFRELAVRAQLPLAMRLLPEAERPGARRGWIELASDALNANALRATLRGHAGALAAAVWSPDGARVLTASADGTARVWRADGAGQPVVLEGGGGAVLAAAWSPDGERALAGSEDGAARVWRMGGAGQPVVLRGHRGAVTAVAASPDGARVLTASADGTARVWRMGGEGAPVVLTGHRGRINAAAWSPDGARVVTASDDRTARVWLIATGRSRVLRGHTGEVISVAVSPDGARVVTGSRDRTARVFTLAGAGAPVVLAGHDDSVLHAAVSPDGLRVATASADRTVRVWSAAGGAEPVVLSGHALAVTFVSWRPDGEYVASASADRTARLWPADGSGPPLVLVGHRAPLRAAAWSPDGARVVTAASDPWERSSDRTAKVWSAEPLRAMPRRRRDLGFFHAASIVAGGERVVAAFEDRTARVFRVDGEGEPVVLRGHEGWVASAAPSSDGARVVTASFDRAARVWSADGKGEPVVLRGHEAEVRAAVLSPDGERVVTASDDGTARVWRADGEGEPVVLRGHEDWLTSAAWSPDGARVLTTSLDHTARVWRARGEAEPVVLRGHGGGVHAGAWSPDGERVVTASDDGTARVWRADGEGEPAVLRGHDGAVLRALFSPDGERVATSSADATVRLWSAAGEGAPIVLGSSAPVIALAFLDGGQRLMTVAMDNGIHTWSIDVDTLKKRLLTAHTDCLPPHMRVTYLGETASAARDRHAACERSYERAPLLAEGRGR